ncbi:MAG TPA: LysR family transcriptional regulator [Methylophilaceae bacterium]|nr:LysR family transcriptional regulator [Methylophilaceae bacterium]
MRNLNFRHFYYFWMVAKEGHLTRVAEQLHVSQSALSSQIRQLEDQLGYPLFDRNGRTLQLTEVGHIALEYAESIFSLGSELLALMESGELQRVQRLRIGAVATLSRNFQENFLRPILGQPEIKLIIHSGRLEELMEQLKVHRLDLVLSNKPIATEAVMPFRCQRIAEQKVCVVGPEDEELGKLRFPHDLHKVNVLLPGASSDIRTQFDLYCEQLGIVVQPYAEVDDMAMLRLLARDSGGVAVVPEVVVQDEIRAGKLKNYCTLDAVTESFYAITAKRHFELPVLNVLLKRAGEIGW